MGKLKLISDYCDYYDDLCSDDSVLVYKRNLSETLTRGSALNLLRSKGIATIEVKSVSEFNRFDGNLVVYKDINGHHGNGKEVMSVDYAKQIYPTSLASKYIYSEPNIAVKILQVGKRRFKLVYKNEPFSLVNGTLESIEELQSEYSYGLPYPIFSIDYICDNNKMLATDFNQVENLHLLNVEHILDAETVVNEIGQALLAYNKV